MKTSFHACADENHASELAVATALVAKLNLALTSRLAVFLLVVPAITITPGGVR